jgi:hypothetical protein
MMQQTREQYGLTGIAISGYGMDSDIAKSRQAGFVDHCGQARDLHLQSVIHTLASVQVTEGHEKDDDELPWRDLLE